MFRIDRESFQVGFDRFFVSRKDSKARACVRECGGRFFEPLFLQICICDGEVNCRVVGIKDRDLGPDLQSLYTAALLAVMFCKRRIVRFRFFERTFYLVKLRKLLRYVWRVWLQTRDLIEDGNCLLRKALFTVMFGNRAVTFDSGCVVRPFGMK